ncbi:GNAT family acetyltransferase [Vibrio parahaemolyticus O4:K55 str. NY3547]|uniref:GNAT family N-acetyltransferase n=1 Tax=Vibrio parahaemolyticus TaxID=670 RepID=UPI0009B63721|nr:GNAT family N-acetyltransferase [Vibrio parahaemolyticus]OQK10812.1 GNAT family acetyltransferase [Vibrio parahaemolyticus O4:K55 str. NY3547]HCG8513688.1 GNAT family N-acetyltransferase [Vibrio parahaemolyticus]
MDLSIYKIEPLASEHIKEVTSLWRESMTEALGINPVHTFESQAYFLEHILPNSYQVFVVVRTDNSRPVAFMASSESEINQLYVAPNSQNQGIGSYLLNQAKEQSNGSLTLRTFEVNQKAQNFYRTYGFSVYSGNSKNEEGLPDLECRWKG